MHYGQNLYQQNKTCKNIAQILSENEFKNNSKEKNMLASL